MSEKTVYTVDVQYTMKKQRVDAQLDITAASVMEAIDHAPKELKKKKRTATDIHVMRVLAKSE